MLIATNTTSDPGKKSVAETFPFQGSRSTVRRGEQRRMWQCLNRRGKTAGAYHARSFAKAGQSDSWRTSPDGETRGCGDLDICGRRSGTVCDFDRSVQARHSEIHFDPSSGRVMAISFAPYPHTPVHPVNPCFVATAVYRSEQCGEVQVLRRFRDEILLRTALGRLAAIACRRRWLDGSMPGRLRAR